MLGGALACGFTHAGITPLDVTKCNMQVRLQVPHFSLSSYCGGFLGIFYSRALLVWGSVCLSSRILSRVEFAFSLISVLIYRRRDVERARVILIH